MAINFNENLYKVILIVIFVFILNVNENCSLSLSLSQYSLTVESLFFFIRYETL